LAVSRAFGDLALKRPTEIVSSIPEIKVIDHVMDGFFFVIACDGIFDVLSDEETINAAIEGGSSKVLRESYGKLSDDNLTAIVIKCEAVGEASRQAESTGTEKESGDDADSKPESLESGLPQAQGDEPLEPDQEEETQLVGKHERTETPPAPDDKDGTVQKKQRLSYMPSQLQSEKSPPPPASESGPPRTNIYN
jgi:hypothetical protein